MERRGQLEISFGMIFSILLVIFFLAVAFFGIREFLTLQDSAKTGKFLSDFNSDIDRIWKSAQSSQQQEYFLPTRISKVCFTDFNAGKSGPSSNLYDEMKINYFGDENMFFYPAGTLEIKSSVIKNIDIGKTTQSENPFCINSANAKVKIRLGKDISETLVTIGR